MNPQTAPAGPETAPGTGSGGQDVAAAFAAALAARGLPEGCTLDGLLRHERGQAALGAAAEYMAKMFEAATCLQEQGDLAGAQAIRAAVTGKIHAAQPAATAGTAAVEGAPAVEGATSGAGAAGPCGPVADHGGS